MKSAFLAALAAFFIFLGQARAQERAVEKWFYYPGTVATDADTAKFIDYIHKAKAAGYTHIMFDEVYLQAAADMPQSWYDNTAKARKAAEDDGIIIAPVIFNVGYSWRVLYNDSNLAAGLPAVDVPFKVAGDAADADPAAAPRLVNGDFEATNGVLAGWSADEATARCMTVDTSERHGGEASLKLSNFDRLPQSGRGAVAVSQSIPVEPFKYYRLTIWRKTRDLEAGGSTIYIGNADGMRQLSYTNFEVNPEADWTDTVAKDSDWREFQLSFNTLESRAIVVRVGIDGAKSGAVWWDDLKIEPAGLANILRRECTPLVVKSADGKTVYEEGRDFEKVADPRLGMSPMPDFMSALPHPGGSYDIWHKGPAIKLTAGSRINDGDALLVSYFHPHIIYGHQVNCSFTDPKVFDLFKEQMVRMNKLWHAPVYVFGYDEIRVGGWEAQPGGTHYTPGQLLANHIATAYRIFHEAAPDATAYAWSDMFDPYHNAKQLPNRHGYYLCNGDFYRSWEGMPAELRILKWGPAMLESSKWFAERGHKILLSGNMGSVRQLTDVAKQVPAVTGIIFTKWDSVYDELGDYSKAIDAGLAAQSE